MRTAYGKHDAALPHYHSPKPVAPVVFLVVIFKCCYYNYTTCIDSVDPGVRIPPWWHFEFICKINTDQYTRINSRWERLFSVGRRNSTRVDDLAIKMKGKNSSVEGAEEPGMWPRIWVTAWREREKKGEDTKWDKPKNKTKNNRLHIVLLLLCG